MNSGMKSMLERFPVSVSVSPIYVEGCDAEYQDARSAAFYAMGRAIKENTSVAVLVPGMYLPSAYTAITEAWFQKANVIVFAFYDSVSDVKTAWADRCVIQSITVEAENLSGCVAVINECCSLHGPVLINVIGLKQIEPMVDYSAWIDEIRNIDKNSTITCYNSCEIDGVNTVTPREKYGIISKYIGMSVAKNAGYLLCTADCFLLDANVFRTRYANQNMKIVILDDGRLAEIDAENWIASNGWQCKSVGASEYRAVAWLVSQEQQAVLIVK